MTKNYFQELAAELGWKAVDNMAFGAQDGYPFSIEFDVEDGAALYLRFLVDGKTKPCVKLFKEDPVPQITWHAETDAKSGGGILVAVIDVPSDFYAKGALHTGLTKAIWVFTVCGLHPVETCPLCGLDGCDSYAYLNATYRNTHATCLQHRLTLPEKDSRTPRRIKGRYITGVLGAILGGFIAALPNWAQALSKGSVNSALYAFIPILAALLYRLFRGKARLVPSGLIVLASSFFVAVVLESVWYWVALSEQLGYGIPLADAASMFYTSRGALDVVDGMVFSLILMVVGFFPAVVLLRGYAANGFEGGQFIRGAAFVRESAQPHGQNGAPETPPEDEPVQLQFE